MIFTIDMIIIDIHYTLPWTTLSVQVWHWAFEIQPGVIKMSFQSILTSYPSPGSRTAYTIYFSSLFASFSSPIRLLVSLFFLCYQDRSSLDLAAFSLIILLFLFPFRTAFHFLDNWLSKKLKKQTLYSQINIVSFNYVKPYLILL